MSHKGSIVLLSLLLGGILLGCLGSSDGTPASVAPQSSTELLEYVPAGWIVESAEVGFQAEFPLEPAVYFFDVAHMQEELGLPEVSGSDSRQEKLDLILGISNQGLDMVAGPRPESGSTFDEWGWDIADVDQILTLPFQSPSSVLLGDFSRPDIRDRLLEKGFTEEPFDEGFTLFTQDAEGFQFALKDDVLIISLQVSTIEDLVRQKAEPQDSLGRYPAVVELLQHVEQPWGVFLAPVGNLPVDEAYGVGWDLMAITYWVSGETTTLHILYHYPSEEQAREDIALVETTLTEVPSFRGPSQEPTRTWGDLLDLESVEVEGSVLVARASTVNSDLLGNAISSRDYWGLVPGFTPVFGGPGASWQEFVSEEGGFSVEFPGTPTEETSTIDSEFGPLTTKSFTLIEKTTYYGISYTDYPEEALQQIAPEELFDLLRDSVVTNVQGDLVEESSISRDGHPGREFQFNVPAQEAVVIVRFFLVDSRLYTLMAFSMGDSLANGQIFLTSFKLLPG